MRILVSLWRDERGFVASTELILIATIAVIGLIVGLATYRDAIVQEMGDTGAAVGQADQSYSVRILENSPFSFTGGTPGMEEVTLSRTFQDSNGNDIVTVESTFNNFEYDDESDVGDTADVAGDPPAGIMITAALEEGDPLPVLP